MTSSALPQLQALSESLDSLSVSLGPLLPPSSLPDTASKLPLADKARLYVLTAYALESLLFSYLRLNSIDTKDHPIMRELTRVRGYVQKIKEAQAVASGEAAPPNQTYAQQREGWRPLESVQQQQQMALDKGAAERFIKAALAGNEEYDRERAERETLERGEAERKLKILNERMEKEGRGGKEKMGERAVVSDEEEGELMIEEGALAEEDGEGKKRKAEAELKERQAKRGRKEKRKEGREKKEKSKKGKSKTN